MQAVLILGVHSPLPYRLILSITHIYMEVLHLCLSQALSFFLEQDQPLFTADGSMFYTILAAKQGARGEFHHIAGLSAQVGKSQELLSPSVCNSRLWAQSKQRLRSKTVSALVFNDLLFCYC